MVRQNACSMTAIGIFTFIPKSPNNAPELIKNMDYKIKSIPYKLTPPT